MEDNNSVYKTWACILGEYDHFFLDSDHVLSDTYEMIQANRLSKVVVYQTASFGTQVGYKMVCL